MDGSSDSSDTKRHATSAERQVAINLHQKGFTPAEIAEIHLDGRFSARSVGRWIESWELTGVAKPPAERPWVSHSATHGRPFSFSA